MLKYLKDDNSGPKVKPSPALIILIGEIERLCILIISGLNTKQRKPQ